MYTKVKVALLKDNTPLQLSIFTLVGVMGLTLLVGLRLFCLKNESTGSAISSYVSSWKSENQPHPYLIRIFIEGRTLPHITADKDVTLDMYKSSRL